MKTYTGKELSRNLYDAHWQAIIDGEIKILNDSFPKHVFILTAKKRSEGFKNAVGEDGGEGDE